MSEGRVFERSELGLRPEGADLKSEYAHVGLRFRGDDFRTQTELPGRCTRVPLEADSHRLSRPGTGFVSHMQSLSHRSQCYLAALASLTKANVCSRRSTEPGDPWPGITVRIVA